MYETLLQMVQALARIYGTPLAVEKGTTLITLLEPGGELLVLQNGVPAAKVVGGKVKKIYFPQADHTRMEENIRDLVSGKGCFRVLTQGRVIHSPC